MRTENQLKAMALDRKSSIPIYHQIYTQLKRELMLGGYSEGDRFFSFRKLSAIYGVEPRTVGDALNLLIEEGFLEKRPASGMYVTDLKAAKRNGVFTGNIWYVLMGDESFDHPFYFRLLKGIEKAIHHTGLKLTVGIKETSKEFFSWFTPSSGDGIILTGAVKPEFLKALRKTMEENIVVVGTYEDLGGCANVAVDIEGGVADGLEKLGSFKISSLAVIAGAENKYVNRVLATKAESYAANAGIEWLGADFSDDEDGYEAMRRMKDKHSQPPDALLVTEPAYFGICKYAAETRVKCPDELRVIRYGKEPSMKIYDEYAAVNVYADTERIGENAVEMLLNKEERKVEMKMHSEINNAGE